MLDLMTELDKTINMLEAKLPANIESPENQGSQKRLQRDMEEYFKALDTALPFERIENLYYKWVKPE